MSNKKLDPHKIAYYAVRGTNDIQDVKNVKEWINDLVKERLLEHQKHVRLEVYNWISNGRGENILDIIDNAKNRIDEI